MREKFQFNPITMSDIGLYLKSDKCYVINMTKANIESQQIFLTSFENETLGESVERLDVAIFNNGKWEILDCDSYFDDEYNAIPLSFLLNTKEYTKVLCIIRRMSNLITDKVKDSISLTVYNAIPNRFSSLQDYAIIEGILAKYKICLSKETTEEDFLKINNEYERNKVLEWFRTI